LCGAEGNNNQGLVGSGNGAGCRKFALIRISRAGIVAGASPNKEASTSPKAMETRFLSDHNGLGRRAAGIAAARRIRTTGRGLRANWRFVGGSLAGRSPAPPGQSWGVRLNDTDFEKPAPRKKSRDILKTDDARKRRVAKLRDEVADDGMAARAGLGQNRKMNLANRKSGRPATAPDKKKL